MAHLQFRDVVKKYAPTDQALGVPGGEVGGIPVPSADDFATAAQGAKADTAVQPDDLGAAASMSPVEVVTDPDAQAALSGAFASRAASPTLLPLRSITVNEATVRPVDVLADGRLLGAAGDVLFASNDAGASWSEVVDTGINVQITGIRDTGDGEVLLLGETGPLRKSTGWSSNPTTATFETVLSNPGNSYFLPWGVDVNPETGRAVATTYTSGSLADSSKLWLSEDHGNTWEVIFDQETDPDIDHTDAHMHLAALDPWADDRIWTAWHDFDTDSQAVIWSDDRGQSWNTLTTEHQPTVGVATPWGMVFGSDEGPNGIYTVPRTADPADMTFGLAYEWRGATVGILGFANRGFYDPTTGNVLVGFVANDGNVPVIAASNGVSAAEIWRGQAVSTNGDGVRNVMVANGRVIAHIRMGSDHTMLVAPIPAAGVPDINAADQGRVFGGSAQVRGSMAAGYGASAGSEDSTAVGVNASAGGALNTAIGNGAATQDSASTAIGASASALGNGLAVGAQAEGASPSATALGRSARAGSESVAVGRAAWARTQDTILGRNAAQANTTGGTGGTAVGYAATVQSYGTALGHSAAATAQDAVAVGRGASATHQRSVALGQGTATSATDQVEIGTRHLELFELSAAPDAPAVNGARLFVRDNGVGKTELCVRFATGAVQVIATEP